MISTALKICGALFWLSLAVFLIIFSISNRSAVDIQLIPFDTVWAVPVYQILFLGIFIGVLIVGSSLSWLRLQAFVKRRQLEREASRLREEVSTLSEENHHQRAVSAHHGKGEDAAIRQKAPGH